MELIRRASSRPNVGLDTLATMAALHLPHILEVTLPFAMLIAAMAVFWRMSRHHELAVARASGLSIWQLMLPGILTAFVIGVIKVLAFNPLAATSLKIFEDMEARYFNKVQNNPLLSNAGLWLKDFSGEHDLIVHASVLNPKDHILRDVRIYRFKSEDRFDTRIDAESAMLTDDHWLLHKVVVISPDAERVQYSSLSIPTKLNWQTIEKSVTNPKSTPVWELPDQIRRIEESGFSAALHRAHFHATLVSPISLCAMVIIAATFAIRQPRRGGLLLIMTYGALAGIGFYILSQIFLRLGQSGQIPAILAAWAPTTCVLMLGSTWLLYTEDG